MSSVERCRLSWNTWASVLHKTVTCRAYNATVDYVMGVANLSCSMWSCPFTSAPRAARFRVHIASCPDITAFSSKPTKWIVEITGGTSMFSRLMRFCQIWSLRQNQPRRPQWACDVTSWKSWPTEICMIYKPMWAIERKELMSTSCPVSVST